MSDASERHNRLAADFVQSVGHGTDSAAELMVVVESVLLGTMLMLTDLYEVRPTDASVYLEAALQHATRRFGGQHE